MNNVGDQETGRTDHTGRLASFAAGLPFADLPQGLVERIKLHVLDGLGAALHGAAFDWTRQVAALVMQEGSAPVASLWGHGAKAAPAQAALVNGTAGHAFEFDDIHKESVLHPNSIAVPVALALAEADSGIDGTEFLASVVAGYEVGTRVGNAATTSLFLNGFHPQGTSGVFVAAATAGRLLRLDAPTLRQALGIAGSLGSGLMAAQEGAMVKRLHSGRAAQSGLQAALLAQRGFTGITDVLEAPYGGFLSTMSRAPRPERLTSDLGSQWQAGLVGFKLYPNVTSIHAALDAMRHLRSLHGFTAADIDRVEVGCGHMTFVHTAWPYKPEGVTSAQMNLFYGLSVMAIRGAVTPDDYAQHRLADPEVLDFMPRICAVEDGEIDRRGSEARHAARLRVHLRNGTVLFHEVWDRRGSPENPPHRSDIEAKFFDNVKHALSPAHAEEVRATVSTLEAPGRLARLIKLLQETQHAR